MKRTSRKTGTKDGKTKNVSVRVLITGLLVGMIAACFLLAGRELYEYAKSTLSYMLMDHELITEADPEKSTRDEEAGEEGASTEEAPEPEEEIWWPELEIDYEGYAAINENFAAILYFPLFDLRYPVALSQNNADYLTRNFDGSWNSSGCIFMDYQNQKNFRDRNTWLYGHNMADGSMFGSLKRLVREPQRCEGDPKIYVYTPDRILEYQLYVVELAPANEKIRGIYTDKQYDEYIERITGRASFVDTDLDTGDRPDLLTLYTCWGTDYQYKLLVHGVQARVHEENPQKLYPVREKQKCHP